VRPVRLIAWSDYLCPWCYNGSVRLRKLEQEYSGAIEVDYKSYLLRPQPQPGRDLEKFRAYTQGWQRPASEPDSGTFRPWRGDAGPPSHSIPAHLVAKAAKKLGPEAFRALHERLLRAYFAENRDISDDATLERLWKDAGLDPADFAARQDPSLLQQVVAEHNEALERGISGVPTVLLEGQDVPITGAHPMDLYRRWLDRVLSGEA
jgi:predicted DsbA family dithiol-disulfide isomerase